MTSDFLLKGLTLPRSFTCYTMDGKETIFWVKSHLSDERFNALFKWAKSTEGFWKSKWIIEVEHEGFYEDGTPVNPKAIAVREETAY